MGYDLHIERHASDGGRSSIALSEWKSAVNETSGVRLAEGSNQIANPRTGAILSVPNPGGDAEVYLETEDEWRRVFSWSPSGRISFRFTRDFDRPDNAIRVAARLLAQRLGAKIAGDEGEIYE